MRQERPTRRVNPSGKIAWVARWTDKAGKSRVGYKPDIPGTFEKRGPCRDGDGATCCAQHAIWAAYALDEEAPVRIETLGGYAASWTRNHPRSPVTNRTNEGRLRNVLDVRIDGIALRDWTFGNLRRRHANALLAVLLVEQGRSVVGARDVLATLSAMTEDAIDDEVAVSNPFRGVKVRANDPRVQKQSRHVRVWSWSDMRAFAAAAGVVETRGRADGQATREYRAAVGPIMVRLLSDCGLRTGELLALRRSDLHLDTMTLEVRQTLTPFGLEPGTKSDKKRGISDPALQGRVVPLTAELCGMLKAMPKRIDSLLLFPAPRGGVWWREQWWKEVWAPAQARSGLDARPHEFRHAWVSYMRAALVDVADLAEASGHNVDTASRVYTHALNRSFEAMRRAVGE